MSDEEPEIRMTCILACGRRCYDGAEAWIRGGGVPGAETRLPDDAYVVRGGLLTPEDVKRSADENGGFWGISVQSAPGYSVRDLCREGQIPHGKIRVTTVGRVRALGTGFDVVPSPGIGHHGTLLIPSRPISDDHAQHVSSVFDSPVPNPARQMGAAEGASRLMRQLVVDFNNRDERNRVRLGPTARERLRDELAGARPGELVQLIDTEGNTCPGVLRHQDDRWVVEVQWSNWVDAPDPEEPALTGGVGSRLA
jgi:hypothetical protein